MKQKVNNRKKEALRANKHKLDKSETQVGGGRVLVKDLTTTAISTTACIAIAIILFFILG